MVTVLVMIGDQESPRDLAVWLSLWSGALRETGDPWEPYRLVDAAGEPVVAVAEFFGDLQAAGRSEATLRSYGHDLLRWFRFLRAIQVPWAPGDPGRGPRLLPVDAGGGQAGPSALAQARAGRRGEYGEREAVRAIGAGALRDGAAQLL